MDCIIWVGMLLRLALASVVLKAALRNLVSTPIAFGVDY